LIATIILLYFEGTSFLANMRYGAYGTMLYDDISRFNGTVRRPMALTLPLPWQWALPSPPEPRQPYRRAALEVDAAVAA
jgi:hypothetical protein